MRSYLYFYKRKPLCRIMPYGKIIVMQYDKNNDGGDADDNDDHNEKWWKLINWQRRRWQGMRYKTSLVTNSGQNLPARSNYNMELKQCYMKTNWEDRKHQIRSKKKGWNRNFRCEWREWNFDMARDVDGETASTYVINKFIDEWRRPCNEEWAVS